MILPPALLMTLLLTSSPRQTLLLKRPRLAGHSRGGAAGASRCTRRPAVCKSLVQQLYPVSESVLPALDKMSGDCSDDANFWPLLLVIAVVPAVCEELAFRGFILSGFRHLGHKWRAIVCSALLFGLAHGILQQSLIASLLGMVLGYLAVQSGSILPAWCFTCATMRWPWSTAASRRTCSPNWPLCAAHS